jgi:hypothetical protein
MNPLSARVLPALCGGPRVTEPLLRAGAALHELNGLPAGHVDRRQQHEMIGSGGQHADDPTADSLLRGSVLFR